VFTDEPEEAETAESTTTTTTSALKRGTRTTGAGASKRRNPSIFAPSSGGQFNSYQQWTAAALSGDVLNRQHSSSSSTSSKSSKTKVKTNNPMSGRIWARKTDEGLIIKISTAGDDESIPAQIMLSASPDAFNMAHRNEDDEISTPIIQAKHVVKTSDNDVDVSSSSLSISSQFRPLEGIYGIFNLPCSGPHAVLITESEEVYTSPPTTRKETMHSSETPLLQLRRIKSMEIVPLSRNRLETAAQNETI
jgi:hypothetical protein